jgi:quinol monooxygenase YgiN
MSGFGMVGSLSTEPQNRKTLVEILTQAAEYMQDLDGCHMYIVAEDADDAARVWVMELWESREAHDHSLTLPHIKELIGKAMPILTGSPSGAALIPVAGKGL